MQERSPDTCESKRVGPGGKGEGRREIGREREKGESTGRESSPYPHVRCVDGLADRL